jgi:hypothetical protein
MEGTTKKEASPEQIVHELSGVVPAHYVMPPQDRPSAGAGAAPIPVIDLGRLSGPNPDAQEAAKLRSALETWGFFKVTFLSQSEKKDTCASLALNLIFL